MADLGAGGGEDSVQVLDKAVEAAGYKGMAATLTRDSLLRNLDIADKLGCLTATGLAEMKRGRAATVVRGPYAGDQLSVDHIIPVPWCPNWTTSSPTWS